MRARLSFCLFLLATPLPLAAQVVVECDDIARAVNIAEPWEQTSRTYANGAIRVAMLDTGGEPVCCSRSLMVLLPAGGGDEPLYRQCRVVLAQPTLGFYDVDVPGITASYDPVTGLLLSVPIGHWHQGMESGAPPIADRMEVRINQATQTVTVE